MSEIEISTEMHVAAEMIHKDPGLAQKIGKGSTAMMAVAHLLKQLTNSFRIGNESRKERQSRKKFEDELCPEAKAVYRKYLDSVMDEQARQEVQRTIVLTDK